MSKCQQLFAEYEPLLSGTMYASSYLWKGWETNMRKTASEGDSVEPDQQSYIQQV